MPTSFRRLLTGAMLAASCLPGLCAPSVEHEVAALFGLEYDDVPAGGPIRPGSLSCIELEARSLQAAGETRADWQAATARCSGRTVELLKRRLGEQDASPRWRIEDVLLLPAFPESGSRFLAHDGDCAMDDAPGTSFVALMRRRSGRSPTADQVWTYDLDQGRMQQQQARVTCKSTD